MKTSKVLLLFLVALIAGGIGGYLASPKSSTSAAPTHETAYQRVMRTGVLHCGYFIEPPFTILNKDNSMTGIAHELAKKIAKELGLRVEWGEISFATFADDLKNGKYDAICASVFVLPRHGKTDYTITYASVPVYGYARADDTRFDRSIFDADWSKVTIGGLDGEGATKAVCGAVTTANFTVGDLQLVIADFKRPFLARPFALEEQLVFRFLRSCYAMHGIANSGSAVQLQLSHLGMRTTPTYIAVSAIDITDCYAADYTQSSIGITSVQENTKDHGRLTISYFSGLTSGRYYMQKGTNKPILASAEF